MKNKHLEEALENLEDLWKLLTERIYENNIAAEKQPGLLVKQFVHCFLLYRDRVDAAKTSIRKAMEGKK